jgi:predicted O-methyltransferase YrrM
MVDSSIVQQVLQVAPNLHTAGALGAKALRALARHAGARKIRRSVETGCGATTLLLSHLSECHTVFALDAGSGSVANTRTSPLLRESVVTFVEGPTQRTLPGYEFSEPLQLALLDGPHGYPFPVLEYYWLYPHLERGALLILDDIHIPSVHDLFRFLCADRMFELAERIDATAFFVRTDAPTFDPMGDGWWEQEYNHRPLLRYTWQSNLKALVPHALRHRLWSIRRTIRRAARSEVRILSPRAGERVGAVGVASGTAQVPAGLDLWVLVHRRDFDGWWPQGGGPVAIQRGGIWSTSVAYGESRDIGHEFEIAALVVAPASSALWASWTECGRATGNYPPVKLPGAEFVLAEALRRVKRLA